MFCAIWMTVGSRLPRLVDCWGLVEARCSTCSVILVIMMHSTLGLQAALGRTGFLDPVVAFFAPFRISTFFVLYGLFLGRALRRRFGDYAQARVIYFGYSYLLWLPIHVAVRREAKS